MALLKKDKCTCESVGCRVKPTDNQSPALIYTGFKLQMKLWSVANKLRNNREPKLSVAVEKEHQASLTICNIWVSGPIQS